MFVNSSLFAVVAGLVGTASSLAIRATTSSSACPYNYPVSLNNTDSHNGLIFTIVSQDPATNNRAIQLRTVQSGKGSAAPVQVAAIDSHSPVLLAQLQGGSILSANRSTYNQLYYPGPTASLVLSSEHEHNSTLSALQFANSTSPDTDFMLEAPSSTGEYNLYHKEPELIANGFVVCKQSAGWWQLFYVTYSQTPPSLPNCEYISVRTTAAAQISNGKCDIGGYTAS